MGRQSPSEPYPVIGVQFSKTSFFEAAQHLPFVGIRLHSEGVSISGGKMFSLNPVRWKSDFIHLRSDRRKPGADCEVCFPRPPRIVVRITNNCFVCHRVQSTEVSFFLPPYLKFWGFFA